MAAEKAKAAAVSVEPSKTTTLAPETTKPRPLPMFRVILHNDDKNFLDHVAQSIVMLTPLPRPEAIQRTLEAHYTGFALLLVTHKERAELYVDQFQSRGLTVTIEPVE